MSITAFAAASSAATESQSAQTQREYRARAYGQTGATVHLEVQRPKPRVNYTPDDPATAEKQRKRFNLSPSASRVAKAMKGAKGHLIAAGLYLLLDEAVDYVLNPDNNSVALYPDGSCWSWDYMGGSVATSKSFLETRICQSRGGLEKLHPSSNRQFGVSCNNEPNKIVSTITCNAPKVEISLDELAREIISEANKNNPQAQEALKEVALEMVEMGEAPEVYSETGWEDVPSSSTSTDTGTDTNTGTDSQTTPKNEEDQKTDGATDTSSQSDADNKLEFPAFCDWAKPVCDYIDWVKDQYTLPEDLKDEPITVQEMNIDFSDKATKSYISFSGQCPAPVSIPVRFAGSSTDMTLSYEPFCRFASLIKPAVILGAWLSGLLIIIGGRAKGE